MAMPSIRDSSWLRALGFSLISLHWIIAVYAADECAPSVWQPGQFEKRAPLITPSPVSTTTSPRAGSVSQSSSSSAAIATTTPVVSVSPLVNAGDVAPGEVNCRYTTNTADVDINYYTCTALATKYDISVETFFMLNPTVKPDCSNIQADTDYCVSGFVEPVRASGGLCGPPNKNATCLGTDFQCCNANTFTCGNSTADCAPGTCYEGACPGDPIFTTDGKCGQTCFSNLQAQYQALGCTSPTDAYCLCNNVNFGYGIRDCSNGACGTVVASTVIAYGSAYCSNAVATHTATTTTTGLGALPSCGQTCFNNVQAQYSALGCPSPSDAYCLCNNVDFGYGIRDCANGACGTAVGSTVIAYGSTYCAQATATHTGR
ncbi:hypothetical protein GGS20DRAFT_579729 [Poronia punctata]|nr:hypothetical protein GGS20DRAFT_579729 [Poronia punctata]